MAKATVKEGFEETGVHSDVAGGVEFPCKRLVFPVGNPHPRSSEAEMEAERRDALAKQAEQPVGPPMV